MVTTNSPKKSKTERLQTPKIWKQKKEAVTHFETNHQEWLKSVERFLDNISEPCNSIELTSAIDQLKRIRYLLNPVTEDTFYKISVALQELENRIEDELKRRKFFYISHERAKYYEQSHPFGQNITEMFPELMEDVSEASNCLGAGRFTAAVFHLMRVMEASLPRMAKLLSAEVKSNDTWNDIVSRVDKAIKDLPNATTEQQSRKTKFREVTIFLHQVKNAWRNPTMHPKRTYTEEEAVRIFENVRSYMQELAKIR
jgi:hypothetical protein